MKDHLNLNNLIPAIIMNTRINSAICLTVVSSTLLILAISCKKEGNDPSVIKDGDGNLYTSVKIGTQAWLVENLKTTRYSDGTSIPLVTDNTEWYNLSAPGYCWYDNDATGNKNAYGALYNWYTVATGKLCPEGWHVPDDSEWKIMEDYLIANGFNFDGSTTDNLIAKALASTTDWEVSSFPGVVGNTDYPLKRNVTKFSALPGGNRLSLGLFEYIGGAGVWWSSTEESLTGAWSRFILSTSRSMTRTNLSKNGGLSVRCVED